jgi:nucleoside-diphosphate-sugar epimerase
VGDVARAVIAAVGRGSVHPRHDTPVALGGVVADVTRLRALGVPAPARDLATELRETMAWYRSASRAA